MTLAVGGNNGVNTGGNVASLTTTGVTTSASGSGFIIGGIAGATAATVSDSKSNSYTLISEVSYDFSGKFARLWYCANGTGGASHTATVSQGSTFSNMAVMFMEITTGGGGLTIDQHPNGADATSSPFASPSITTTVATEILVSFLAGRSNSNPATHAETVLGMSLYADVTAGATSRYEGCLAALNVSSIQTSINSAFTDAGNTTEAAVYLISFSEAGGSTGNTIAWIHA
jgi:hypothetical protein